MPRKQDHIRNFLLCDNVVTDIQHRHTLVAVYANDILVPEFPARIRLALYGEFVTGRAGDHYIELDFLADGNNILKAVLRLTITDPDQVTPLLVPGLDVAIAQEVDLALAATCNGKRPKELIRKKIKQGTIPGVPSVSRLPPAQSPAAPKGSIEPHD